MNEEDRPLIDNLPSGWTLVLLGDIAKLTRGPFGSTLKKEYFVPSGYKVYEQQNAIYDDHNRGRYYIPKELFDELSRFQAYPNDFLVSCAGTIGKISRLPSNAVPGVINQALLKIQLREDVFNPNLFLHLFRSPLFQNSVLIETRGSAMKNIASVKDLNSLKVSVPPLNEQKRIADKLDVLLAGVDICRERLERVPQLLKRFRQSVLAAAVSGKLTENWRERNASEIRPMPIETLMAARSEAWLDSQNSKGGLSLTKARKYQEPQPQVLTGPDSTLPLGWVATSVDLVTHLVTDGKHGDCNNENGSGYYFLSVKDLFDGELNYDEAREISHDDFMEVHQRTNLEIGDVLLTNTGATIGRVAVARDRNKTTRTTFQKSVAVLKPVRKVLSPDYLAIHLESEVETVKKRASGSAVPNLLLRDIRSLRITLPPVDEQLEIVRRVATLFCLVQLCEAKLAAGLLCVERAVPSLLAKAFRGELVPQNSDDEPALELLARTRNSGTEKLCNKTGKKTKKENVLAGQK